MPGLKTPPSRPSGPAPPRLDFGSNGMSMTPEEFDAVTEYDPQWRYELIRGLVIVSPIPDEAHEELNEELGHLLRSFRESHPAGTALDATLPNRYVATSSDRRLPDRVIWAGLGRQPDPHNDVPAIVVEFVSRSRRDRQRDYLEKREEYRQAGIQEYWIIDRFRRQMTVSFVDGSEQNVPEEAIYSTPLQPGFELPLSRLLAAADRWDKST